MVRAFLYVFAIVIAGCEATPVEPVDASNDGGVGIDADPSVMLNFVQPMAGTTVFGTVPIVVTANPMTGLRAVDLYVNGAVVHRFPMGSTMLSVALDTSTFADGPTALRVTAAYEDGRANETSIMITIANLAPAGRFVTPAMDETRFVEDGPFDVTVMTNGAGNITSATLRAGERVVMEERPPTSDTLTATLMPLEFYPATASAPIPLPLELSLVDNRGQTTTIRVTVTLRTRLRWQSPRLEGAVLEGLIPLPDGAIAAGTTGSAGGGRVYVLGPDGTQRCRALPMDDSGATETVQTNFVLLPGGTRFVYGTDRHLRAINTSDCSVAWTHASTVPWLGELSVDLDRGTVYATELSGILHAVAADSGTDRWMRSMSEQAGGSVMMTQRQGGAVARDGTVLIVAPVGSSASTLLSYDSAGTPLRTFPSVLFTENILVTESNIYLGAEDGFLYENELASLAGVRTFELTTGTAVPLPARCSPRRLRTGAIATCDRQGVVYGFSLATGDRLWTYDAKDAVPDAPVSGVNGGGLAVDASGTIFFGDVLGVLHALNPDGTLKWRVRIGTGNDALEVLPALTNDTVFVATDKNFIYAFALD